MRCVRTSKKLTKLSAISPQLCKSNLLATSHVLVTERVRLPRTESVPACHVVAWQAFFVQAARFTLAFQGQDPYALAFFAFLLECAEGDKAGDKSQDIFKKTLFFNTIKMTYGGGDGSERQPSPPCSILILHDLIINQPFHLSSAPRVIPIARCRQGRAESIHLQGGLQPPVG